MVPLETPKTGPTRTPDPLTQGDGLPEPPKETRKYAKRRTPDEIDLDEKATRAEAREKLRKVWRAKAEKHIGMVKGAILGFLSFIGRRSPRWSPTEDDLPQIDAMAKALALVGAKWEPDWLDNWKEEFDALTEIGTFMVPKVLADVAEAAGQSKEEADARPVEAEIVGAEVEDGAGKGPYRARKAG